VIRGRVCETRLDAPAKKVSCHQTDRTANQRPRPGCKGWWLSLRGLGALSSGAADTARAGYKRERHERRAERSRRDCSVSINAAISPDRRLLSRLSGRDSELVGSQVAAGRAEDRRARRRTSPIRSSTPGARVAIAPPGGRAGKAGAGALPSGLRRWAAATADVLRAIDAGLEHPFVTRTSARAASRAGGCRALIAQLSVVFLRSRITGS